MNFRMPLAIHLDYDKLKMDGTRISPKLINGLIVYFN